MAPQSLREFFANLATFITQLPLGGFSIQNAFGPSHHHGLRPAYAPLSGAPSCPLDGPLSCHNSTPITGDSCCFIHPGGRMLLTQFWDEEAHSGVSEEGWTIHGLWPDLCDGGFDSYCGLTPHYNNISAILKANGQDELLAFMDRYWVADRGSNEHLWTHEYNKHATCINTLAPSCYSSSPSSSSSSDEDTRPATTATSPGEMAMVDYFTRATALFKMLDTYTALDRAGITPRARTRYPLADVQAALERLVGGGKVVLRCVGSRRDVLREAWFHYFVQGSLQTGEFVPARDLGRGSSASNCAPWVRYLPKTAREL